MEDNRKGTWEDVTNYCGTRSSVDGGTLYVCYPGKGYVRALLGKHGIYGHCVEGGAAGDSPNARGYRLARPTADTWAIEHFIPDPEWVDVTEECTLRFGYTKNHVVVVHDSVAVLSLGDKAYEERDNNAAHGYRVIFEKNDFQGYFKVEKRNG